MSLRFILILSARLCLGLPSGLFPSGFPANILYAFLYSIRATCPAHLILIDLNILIILGEEYTLHSHIFVFLLYTTTSFGLTGGTGVHLLLCCCDFHFCKRLWIF
jgi:hypothetical protein